MNKIFGPARGNQTFRIKSTATRRPIRGGRAVPQGSRRRPLDLQLGLRRKLAPSLATADSGRLREQFLQLLGAAGCALGSFCARVWTLLTCGERASCPEQEICALSRSNRMRFLACCCFVAAIGVGLRLCTLQGIQSASWTERAKKQYNTELEVKGARGNIVDRYGRTLSSSVETLAVALHPTQVPSSKHERTAELLSVVIDRPPSEIRSLLEQPKSFVWLAKGLAPAKRLELEKLRLNGISFYPEFDRYYPQGSLAGPLLGTVGKEGEGLSGIELAFNDQLRAQSFELAVRRDARGRLLTSTAWKGGGHSISDLLLQPAALRSANSIAPAILPEHDGLRQEGGEIVLTLDSMLQSILEDELVTGVRENKAKRAFGVIVDADSGDILALAQAPSFNPNQQTGLSGELLRNFLAQDNFEPGSTFKPLVAAAALERKTIGANEIMDCEVSGRYRVGRHTIRDVHPVGVVPLRDVLVRSSNICMSKIGARLGPERLHDAIRELGFGSSTGIELPGEAKGIVRSLANWKTIDTATSAFGQGIAVTGLQLVRGYAALANGGMLPELRLVISSNQPKPAKRVFSQAVADRIALYLQGVTEDKSGTAQRARISGISVAGKTGTAQKPVIGGRGYRTDAVMSSFVGFVNGNELGIERRLVAYIVVDEPGVFPRWGGVVAAPIFKRTMERSLSHLITLQEVRSAAVSAKASSRDA